MTGLRFVWNRGLHPLSPSLDRPDSRQPYSRENFRIVCWAVNAGCGAWGLEAYLAIAARALGSNGPPFPKRFTSGGTA